MTHQSRPNSIILTGFMGTGKSTIGRRLAQRLGFKFVDMDTLLEARQGRLIRDIFEAEGEVYFRNLESQMCRELAGWRHRVISTGGGTLVNPDNLATFTAQNLVICLDCDPEELWRRLDSARNRPMLDGDDRKQRLLDLLQQRQPAYDQIEQHIDTTGRTVEAVVDEALSLWRQFSGK
jgi:shikimate kinase